ncbi:MULTISPECIES: hypothetical protein [Bacillaceae]|uniref:YkzH n=1 Tax=Oceanobacillus caeni TaxID=405946 RepID=A0ABR5MJZ5_9BACI|nr:MULTISPECIES: hypothetical protein [Bacillaceae]KPH76003.1 hypothetical protein AFL42_07410 [Oceanobacillus caeni]MED4474830.1 hypothetical protein [Oceanobacillus caeni]
MSSHNPYQLSWYPYSQSLAHIDKQGGPQGHDSTDVREMGTKAPSDMYGSGILPAHTLPFQDTASQGYTSANPASTNPRSLTDIQDMRQMMINLENQLYRLNQLIELNNQLLQSMCNQEDTKYVQGSGGSAIIVRM